MHRRRGCVGPRPGRAGVFREDQERREEHRHRSVLRREDRCVEAAERRFHATISPAAAPAVAVLAAHAAEQTPDLPGISGDAATAAFFAGCWAEQRKTPAVPLEGQRLYELGELRHPDGVPGALRRAERADEQTILTWMQAFERETASRVSPSDVFRRRIADGLVWIWSDNGEPVATAGFTPPVSGVSRV